MVDEIELRARRGEDPWSPEELLKAIQDCQRHGVPKVMARLLHEHGSEKGHAFFVRMFAAAAFIERYREALVLAKLVINDSKGEYLTGGLLEALATRKFSKADTNQQEETTWDFDPREVFIRAKAVNAMPG